MNTLNGYSKSTLTDNNVLTASGGHLPLELLHTTPHRSSFELYDTLPMILSGKTLGANCTIVTAGENTAPHSKVYLVSGYCAFYSPETMYFTPGETICIESWIMRPSGATGTAGTYYLGINFRDKLGKPINSNNGCIYFGQSTNWTCPCDGVWYKRYYEYTIPISHTSYNGSDGGGYFSGTVRCLINYYKGTIPTYYGGFRIYKKNIPTNLLGGLYSYQYFRQLGTNANINSFGNNSNKNGIIYINTTDKESINSPFNYGSILSLNINAASWMLACQSNGKLLFRDRWWSEATTEEAGLWSDWKELAFKSDIPTTSTLDSRYVKKSGDTMSGNLEFPAANFITQTAHATNPNYVTLVKWYKGNASSSGTYDAQIGWHNTENTNGSITLLPYTTTTSPWSGKVGVFISKINFKYNSHNIFHSGSNTISINNTSGNSDPVTLELYRKNVSSWRFQNNLGDLHILNNYTTTVGSYFDVLTLNYNTGDVTLKGALKTANINSKFDLTLRTIGETNTIKLKCNNDDTKSVILNGTSFKPFDDATGKLTLGSPWARWSNIYATTLLEIYNSTGGTDIGTKIIGKNYSIGFIISSGNTNRGIYDYTNSKWILCLDSGSTIFNSLSKFNAGIAVTSAAYFGGGTTYYFGSTGNVKCNALTVINGATISEGINVTGGITATGQVIIKGTATDKPLVVRGIVGYDGSANIAELYLQYGADKAIHLGNTGAYTISKDGGIYSGAAARLSVNGGSTSKPIYFANGVPTEVTSIDNSLINVTGGTSTLTWNTEITLATIAGREIKAKLPSNPNSDTKVTQIPTTINGYRPIVLGNLNNNGETTNSVYTTNFILVNPSNGVLQITGSGGLNIKGSEKEGGGYNDPPLIKFMRGTETDNHVDWAIAAGGSGFRIRYKQGMNSWIDIFKTTTGNAYIYKPLSITGGLSLTGALTSTVATGTAPLSIISTTKVNNLNADLLDGYHASSFVQQTDLKNQINELNVCYCSKYSFWSGSSAGTDNINIEHEKGLLATKITKTSNTATFEFSKDVLYARSTDPGTNVSIIEKSVKLTITGQNSEGYYASQGELLIGLF